MSGISKLDVSKRRGFPCRGQIATFFAGWHSIVHPGATIQSGTFHIAPEIRFLLYWQATMAEFQVGSEGHANAIRLTQSREKELDGKFVKPYLGTPVVLGEEEEKECPIYMEVMVKEDLIEVPCGMSSEICA
jgi:hypothetical protein